MIEALGKGVVLRPVVIYEGRRRRWKVKAFRPDCSDAVKKEAVKFCKEKVGLKYDFFLVAGILRAIWKYHLDRKNEWDHHSRFTCSELIGKAYADSGHHFANPETIHVSNLAPGDIIESPGKYLRNWPPR